MAVYSTLDICEFLLAVSEFWMRLLRCLGQPMDASRRDSTLYFLPLHDFDNAGRSLVPGKSFIAQDAEIEFLNVNVHSSS